MYLFTVVASKPTPRVKAVETMKHFLHAMLLGIDARGSVPLDTLDKRFPGGSQKLFCELWTVHNPFLGSGGAGNGS